MSLKNTNREPSKKKITNMKREEKNTKKGRRTVSDGRFFFVVVAAVNFAMGGNGALRNLLPSGQVITT